MIYGVRIRNNGTAPITSFQVAYTGEQWRNGGNATAQTLAFSYKLNATAITDAAGYTSVTALNFTSPIATTTAAALDGNAAANRTALTATITLTVPVGDDVWLRWTDVNDASTDHGFGVDDFTFTAPAAPPAPVTVTQTVQDGRGYRLLSAPVTAYTVGTLATVNLVQGITGQYVNAPDNLYLDYTGVGTVPFTPADNEGQTLQPGRGFFWVLYDQNIDSEAVSGGPLGTGTSDSFVIPERQLTATGTPLAATTTVDFTTATPDKFYMIGNPFARALSASAISVPGGLQGGLVSAYQSNPAGYVQIFQAPPGAQQSALAVWQGVFAETIDPAPPTFTFDFTAAVPATPPFIGRAAPSDALALTLAGTTADGETTLDGAATVRFVSEATTGWDALDASKLTTPADVYALVAPVGMRDGSAYRQGVLSLPAGSTADVMLAFTTTTAGTFTLSADATGLSADATVRDLVTGTVARLTDGVTFTSAATDWTERFVVSFGRTTAGEGTTAAVTSLSAPRPNPVTGAASLTLRLAAPERVVATLVDALGRTVATLYDADAAASTDIAIGVDASSLAPGMYVVRVQGATFAETRRLTVVR